MDWLLARERSAPGQATAWNPSGWARIAWQRGGAALLADLVEALAPAEGGWRIRQTGAPREPVQPGDGRFHHAYTVWSPCEFKLGSREKPAWRVEESLGLDRRLDGEPAGWQQVVDDTPCPDLLVLDDDNLGFRDDPALWPLALGDGALGKPWVVLKSASPVAQGPLWERLQARCADRLIVVTTVDDLRRTEVQISRGLSWERTAQDVAWELVHNPRVNAFARCAHVVISFGAAGAMLLSRPAGEGAAHAATLLFDPRVLEGEWEHDYPGRMLGYTTCLAAGIVRQVLLAPTQPDIRHGLYSGLAALRRLHQEGYGPRGASPAQVRLGFPHALIAATLAQEPAGLTEAAVQDPVRFLMRTAAPGDKGHENGYWTILRDRYAGSLGPVAQRIVLEGADAALQGVPLGRFGGLLTVDRREIESFRSVRALVAEYSKQGRGKKPLSIAVFGAPGSGKSFGITQVARSLLPGQIEVLEFNLSQMASPDELTAALHRVRDVSLTGQLPLVFWDEFDTPLGTTRLGWLRYFLAPMQDGAFREGQAVHPIGPAIFVFAGGTCACLEEFGHRGDPEAFRAAKGPDFVSRLKGYVNVLGPNPQAGADDPYCIIRRAILLRSLLQRNAPQLLSREQMNIDPGVLRALLEVRQYRHGARSMEAIVAMSLLAGRTAFERSCLPAEAQLDLHVDGREFLALVQQVSLEGELLERLALAAHELFCESISAQGYRWGPQTSDALRTHSALRPYAELPEDEKEQNRGTVRDIPHKLALAGYIMLPARSSERPAEFPGADLERLSELEHERWLQAKLAAGWRYAPVTNKAQKEHADLVPWDRLPEEEKEKDRVLVREIPRILARAGYAMMRLHREGPQS